MKIAIEELMTESGVKFGTSGARGLVSAMTDRVVYAYTSAFLAHICQLHSTNSIRRLALAGDLRPSSPRIMRAIARAALDEGYEVINCGFIPSPAVVLYGMSQQIPSIMVTGSHIPDDRNGIKFHRAEGEIDKLDEKSIRASLIQLKSEFTLDGDLLGDLDLPEEDLSAIELYHQRWLDFFGSESLRGLNLGVYQHSTVGRDSIVTILESLGAQVTPLARSEKFIPVDTEAIRPEDVTLAYDWCQSGEYDAIISADGDCDRPLLSNEKGEWIRGDVLGVLTSEFLNADAVATPVSCNTALEESRLFQNVLRTKIGSPFVIQGMLSLSNQGSLRVVGYEANGGFLQWSRLYRNGIPLESLPTRDPMIAVISCLVSAHGQGRTLSNLVADLPHRFTASDRIQGISTAQSHGFLHALKEGDALSNFKEKFALLENVVELNELDGLRFTLDNSEVIHLRPSGNAPELRCYVEASSQPRSRELLQNCLSKLMKLFSP